MPFTQNTPYYGSNSSQASAKLLQGAQAENDRLRKQNEKLKNNQTYFIGVGIVAAAAAATAGYFYGNPAAFNASVEYIKGIPSAITNLFASTVDPIAKAEAASKAAEAAVTACGKDSTCVSTAQAAAQAAKSAFDDLTTAQKTLNTAQETLSKCTDDTCRTTQIGIIAKATTAFNSLAAPFLSK